MSRCFRTTSASRPKAETTIDSAPQRRFSASSSTPISDGKRAIAPRARAYELERPSNEAHVKGLKRTHPDVPEEIFAAPTARSRHPAIIDHLRKLGVTAIEPKPVQTSCTMTSHLVDQGLAQLLGYNTTGSSPRTMRTPPAVIRGQGRCRSSTEQVRASCTPPTSRSFSTSSRTTDRRRATTWAHACPFKGNRQGGRTTALNGGRPAVLPATTGQTGKQPSTLRQPHCLPAQSNGLAALTGWTEKLAPSKTSVLFSPRFDCLARHSQREIYDVEPRLDLLRHRASRPRRSQVKLHRRAVGHRPGG